MCECVDYEDGDAYLCPMCNDERLEHAAIVARCVKEYGIALALAADGFKAGSDAAAALEIVLGDLTEPLVNPF